MEGIPAEEVEIFFDLFVCLFCDFELRKEHNKNEFVRMVGTESQFH